jgi:hypothetical protein
VAALAAGAVVSVVPQALTLLPAEAQTAPSRPVDTDITSYVLFGFSHVEFKGGNATGRGIIRGGNVGSNGVDTGDPDPTINICANGRAVMSDGSQVVGDTVRFARECDFWDLFANRVVGEGGGTVNSGPTPVTIPVVAQPPLPAMACDPSRNVTVRAGDPPTSLPPGTYGAVEFQNGTDVTLSAGLYQMCSFHTGQRAIVRVAPGTEMRVTGRFNLGDATEFGRGAACSTRIYARGDNVGANDATINFGESVVAAGHFLTHKRIDLGRATTLFGTFWGDHIGSDFNVNIDYCPPQGEFPFTKSIAGPGAGSQGEIQIQITCLPSPPNSSIPPFVIPPGAAPGDYSTVVTGVTLPAICRAVETVNGDNETVDPVVPLGRSAPPPPETVVCPDVGHNEVDLRTGRRRSLPPATIVDVFDTTSTSSSTTTTESTTTTTDGSTTTTESTTTTTTTTLPTTTSTTTPLTLPPEACVLPTVVTTDPGGENEPLARTGGAAGLLVGVFLTAIGVVLVVAGRRRPADDGRL